MNDITTVSPVLQTTWGARQGCPVEPWQSGLCGAVAGGLAAAVTTPLDVAKTRIMLAAVSDELQTWLFVFVHVIISLTIIVMVYVNVKNTPFQ